jgi:hypothetical protein
MNFCRWHTYQRHCLISTYVPRCCKIGIHISPCLMCLIASLQWDSLRRLVLIVLLSVPEQTQHWLSVCRCSGYNDVSNHVYRIHRSERPNKIQSMLLCWEWTAYVCSLSGCDLVEFETFAKLRIHIPHSDRAWSDWVRLGWHIASLRIQLRAEVEIGRIRLG